MASAVHDIIISACCESPENQYRTGMKDDEAPPPLTATTPLELLMLSYIRAGRPRTVRGNLRSCGVEDDSCPSPLIPASTPGPFDIVMLSDIGVDHPRALRGDLEGWDDSISRYYLAMQGRKAVVKSRL